MPKTKLYISCPADECENPDKTKKHWIHNQCGGNTMIDVEQLEISCNKCFEKAIIFEWNFACSFHTFKPGSVQGWLHSISTMSQSETSTLTLMAALTKINLYYLKAIIQN